jgi:hypothetical protein
MTVSVHIPADVEGKLRVRAQALGLTVEAFVAWWLERQL